MHPAANPVAAILALLAAARPSPGADGARVTWRPELRQGFPPSAAVVGGGARVTSVLEIDGSSHRDSAVFFDRFEARPASASFEFRIADAGEGARGFGLILIALVGGVPVRPPRPAPPGDLGPLGRRRAVGGDRPARGPRLRLRRMAPRARGGFRGPAPRPDRRGRGSLRGGGGGGARPLRLLRERRARGAAGDRARGDPGPARPSLARAAEPAPRHRLRRCREPGATRRSPT